MDDNTQRRVLDLVHDKSTAGATVLIRSVESEDLIARHHAEGRFQLLQEISANASAEDRSCLYQLVNFYTLN
jgi:hypothetical protein